MREHSRFWPWLLALLGVGGCSDIWGSSTRPDGKNCVRNPALCGGDEVCNTDTEACEPAPAVDAGNDRSTRPAPPASYILPGGLTRLSLDYPRDANYVIATESDATIYYTLDGSAPQPGMGTTLAAASPLNLTPLLAGTTVRWLADYGQAYSLGNERSFIALKTNPSPPDMGVIPEPAYFDLNGASIVGAAPGQRLTGNVHFQAWHSTPSGYCPGCFVQYVVSVEGVGPVGCMETVTGSGSYPGQSNMATFAFDAPLSPGRYRMYSGLTLQFSCDGTVADGPDVGEIFVQ